MATYSGILACKILRTEEPVRLQSLGSQSWTRLSDFERERERERQNKNIEVTAKKQCYHFSFWYHISKLSFKSDNIQ